MRWIVVYRLEYLPPPPPVTPPRAEQINCILTDAGYSRTFFGTGSNQIDAEYEARQSCSKAVHASYCDDDAKLRCDSTLQATHPKTVCMVTDSGYGRTFRGEGSTAIEAEAKAKMSCQSSVHASYCANVTARCTGSF